uniref:Uncharacterized protein n=1 Tax=Ananas comosus var. bracteatus TaxID=296719 RepID=A0A6V7NWG6_ANACO|nr:unnamed protein product [Ananas comosus var. bracteatus]
MNEDNDNEREDDDHVWEDDTLTWSIVAKAAGVDEPSHHTRSHNSTASTKGIGKGKAKASSSRTQNVTTVTAHDHPPIWPRSRRRRHRRMDRVSPVLRTESPLYIQGIAINTIHEVRYLTTTFIDDEEPNFDDALETEDEEEEEDIGNDKSDEGEEYSSSSDEHDD